MKSLVKHNMLKERNNFVRSAADVTDRTWFFRDNLADKGVLLAAGGKET